MLKSALIRDIILLLLFFLMFMQVYAQRLSVFGAELGKKERNGLDLRYPYSDTKCYFGFIDSTWEVSDSAAGKHFYYLYFNLPQKSAEMGIRMMSPVSPVIFPDKGDVVQGEYFEYRKLNNDWFDPWIALERRICYNDSLNEDSVKYDWIMLGSNDDNEEIFAQPSGKKNNSLIRIISDTLQAYKELEAGIYRIAITSIKEENFNGSFLVQIGAAIKLNGLKISRIPTEIPLDQQ